MSDFGSVTLAEFSDASYDILLKALMIGESGVGKTAFVTRYQDPLKKLPMRFLPTLGIDYIKIDQIIDGIKVRTQLWDTVGQERFRTITKNYFRGAKGVLLLFDVTDRNSFNRVQEWVLCLKQFKLENEELFLVGNKIDLDGRIISYEEGKQLALSNGMKYFETSAKTGENVKETVHRLILNMKDANHHKISNSIVPEDIIKPVLNKELEKTNKVRNLSCCSNLSV